MANEDIPKKVTAFEKHWVTSGGMRTVCEVLREIYWHTEDSVVKDKCLEAERMAKKMDAKLREYKADWDKDLPKIENPEEIAKERRDKYENSGDDVR